MKNILAALLGSVVGTLNMSRYNVENMCADSDTQVCITSHTITVHMYENTFLVLCT